MKTCIIIAAAITVLTASTAIAQTFETVDKSPAGDRFEKSANVDILGIQPGDTIEDVKSKLKAEFPDKGEPEETRLKGSVSTPEGARVEMEFVNEIALGGLFVNFASEVYDNRALAVHRILHFDKFTTAEIFRKQVADKYGPPSYVDEEGDFLNLYYFYAGGRVLSEDEAPVPKEGCNRINEGPLCDHVEWQKSSETGKKLEIAVNGGVKSGQAASAIFRGVSAGLSGAALGKTVAFAVHLEDVDVVGDAVEQRASQTLGSQRFGPFVKGKIAGDQGRAALVALRDQLEQQLRPGL